MIIETSLGQLVLYTYVMVMFVLMGSNRIVVRDWKPKDLDPDTPRFLKVLPFVWPFMLAFFVFYTIPQYIGKVYRKGFRK